MNGKLLAILSSMELLLVFVTINVLNALMVVSSANNEYMQFSLGLEEQTNRFGSSLQYKYIENVTEYVNQLHVELVTWKCAQYQQVNSLTAVSMVQMFNKKPMQFKNEIIRIPQNKLSIHPKKFKKTYDKTPTVSTFTSISTTSMTFYKLTSKPLSYSTFANGEVEVMTPPSNEIQTASTRTSMIFEALFAVNCHWYHIGADSEIKCKHYLLSPQIYHHKVSSYKCLSSTSPDISQVLVKLQYRQDTCNFVVTLLSEIWTYSDGDFDTLFDKLKLLAQVVMESQSLLSNCSLYALMVIEALTAQIRYGHNVTDEQFCCKSAVMSIFYLCAEAPLSTISGIKWHLCNQHPHNDIHQHARLPPQFISSCTSQIIHIQQYFEWIITNIQTTQISSNLHIGHIMLLSYLFFFFCFYVIDIIFWL
ncbi:hypothetical protein RFI_29920 [Reticulomyxa filosa]|uniref:Uncharacterized protein n=1 Tax=Reticulomyxa filosa TaxID=46433 RepID=X6LZY1_RETFI|nr:hypothetical protein RFI_29920 [Reticulomyxa filosa]|eukprot:ETO07473.1 hypothetical protein RFI_29920 [Reticulomyxa filosa]